MALDVEDAVLAKLAEDPKIGEGFGRLPVELKEAIAEHTAVIRARKVGGGRTRQQLRPRVMVDIYTATREDLRAATEAAADRLVDWRRHPVDKVDVDSDFAEVPYPDSAVRAATATFLITARR